MTIKEKETLAELILLSIEVFQKIPSLDRKLEHEVIKHGIQSSEITFKGFRSSMKFKEEIEKEKLFNKLSQIVYTEIPQLFGYLTYPGVCVKLPEIHALLFRICNYITNQRNTIDLNDRIYNIISEIENILKKEKIELEVIVLINGIHIRNENTIIEFDHNFKLKKLTHEELSLTLTVDYLFDQLKINPNFYSIVGLTLKTEVEITFSIDAKTELQSTFFESLDEKIRKIIESIHLVKEGSIQVLGKFFKYSPDFIPNLSNSYYSSNPYEYLPANVITEQEITKIKKIYKELGKKYNHKLNIAISRLSDSENRISPIDSLIDSVIGIESLLNPNESGEQTFKMSLYYAFLFEKEKRKENYTLLKSVFNAQNKIVHGGIGKNKSFDQSLLNDVLAAKNVLRNLIEKFLFDENLKTSGKDYWIDLIFYNEIDD